MIAQHVADVLAQEALNAFAELLHAVDIFLGHAPGPIRRVRHSGLKWFDGLLDFEVPGDVRHQISDRWKRSQWLYGDGFVERQLVQPRHAHQPRHAVDFSGA